MFTCGRTVFIFEKKPRYFQMIMNDSSAVRVILRHQIKLYDTFWNCRRFSCYEEYFTGLLPLVDLSLGHIVEFGVFVGTTINILADLYAPRTVWGFDSFEGLPEPWQTRDDRAPIPQGTFKLDQLPAVRPNVVLAKGWFHDSLPAWTSLIPGNVSLVHIDCDLYSSAKTVLTLLQPRIVVGTVIVFDEIIEWRTRREAGRGFYVNWQNHEWRALNEWIDEHDREVVPIARCGWTSGAVRVTR